jgi:hypothetical protein
MKNKFAVIFASLILGCALSVNAQTPTPTPKPLTPQQQASRDATREKLRTLLATTGPKVNIDFKQSEKQPYNFAGVMRTGLKNADFIEVVVTVSRDETVNFSAYPHYKSAYMNVGRAKDGTQLMRQMLNLNHHNFMFWGADDTGDMYAGYTITLESGFPTEAVNVILWSIKPLDEFIGDMRPNYDGSAAVK